MSRARLSAVVVALVCVAGSAHAFELERVDRNPCGNAQNVFWAGASATVDASFLQPAQFATYAIQAQQRWNQAVSTFHFQSGHGSFCNGSDGITSMGFANQVCDGSSFGDAVSITFYQFDARTGHMLDADVTFKASDPNLTDQVLFTQIAMHELGHVLGLAHSDSCGASGRGTLMQAVTLLSDPRLDKPQPDDIAGAQKIYGGGSSGDGTVPPGTNSCAITPHTSPSILALVPLFFLIAARIRSRWLSR